MVDVDMTAVDARVTALRPCPSWCFEHVGIDPGEPEDVIFHLGRMVEFPVDGYTDTLLVRVAGYESYLVAEERFLGPRELFVELSDSPRSHAVQLRAADTLRVAEQVDRAVAAHAATPAQGTACPSWCVIDHDSEPEDPRAEGWQDHLGAPTTVSVRRPWYTDVVGVRRTVHDFRGAREILVELSVQGPHVGDWSAWLPLSTARQFTDGLRAALDQLREL